MLCYGAEDPVLPAWKFTPHAFNWPTDKECLLWAEAGKRNAKKRTDAVRLHGGFEPALGVAAAGPSKALQLY